MTEDYDSYVTDCVAIGHNPLTKDEYDLICTMKNLIVNKDKDMFMKQYPEIKDKFKDKFKNIFGCHNENDVDHVIMCLWSGLL